MNISIKISNKKVFDKFGTLNKIFKINLSKTVKQLGGIMVGKVKGHITKGTGMWKAPIDTGALRQGIGMRASGLKAVIESAGRTDYAIYVHDGTFKMRKRPFMDITAKEEKRFIEKFVAREIDKEVKRILR